MINGERIKKLLILTDVNKQYLIGRRLYRMSDIYLCLARGTKREEYKLFLTS